jgi:23S rRNA (uracil1939-C5)-methyltransferase
MTYNLFSTPRLEFSQGQRKIDFLTLDPAYARTKSRYKQPLYESKRMLTDYAIITSLSHDGRGIAHIDGKITFIKGALLGEKVSITYLKKHSKYDEAKVDQIFEAAKERVTPPCSHFGNCAGCSLQYLDSNAQLAFKEQLLLTQLQHLGGVQPEIILPPLTGPTLGYRRKARLSVKYVQQKNKVLVGFHEANGRYIAEMTHCSILDTRIGEKIHLLAELIQALSIYMQIPQIEIACGDEVVALVIRVLSEPTPEDKELITKFAIEQQLQIYLQPGGPETVALFADPFKKEMSYKIAAENIEFKFQATDFIQVNAAINQKMVAKVLEILEPQADETILDLFCGLGNFTLPLARHAKEVIGVEGEHSSVKRAKENALYNKISNVSFYTANLAEENFSAPWLKQKFSKILLDPPRTGAKEIIKLIANLGATKIVYVSCNPATLARDLKELIAEGYVLKKTGVLDMFPHTSHVESIAVLE